jgi:MoaA/NifB/PqqE/SkfB family radical SAM enzyme
MDKENNPIDEFYFQWHITERCNKHCQHCYQNEHPKSDLPIAELERILGQLQIALTKWRKKVLYRLLEGNL